MKKRRVLQTSTKRSFPGSNVHALRSILKSRLLSATYGPVLVLYRGDVHGDGFTECWPGSVVSVGMKDGNVKRQ